MCSREGRVVWGQAGSGEWCVAVDGGQGEKA